MKRAYSPPKVRDLKPEEVTPEILDAFRAVGEPLAAPLLTETVAALLDARDALANAVAWLDDMHPTTTRIERRKLYSRAHEAIASELERDAIAKAAKRGGQ